MPKKGITHIQTDKAPEPIGCYSQAVQMHDFVFTSGQIGIEPSTMKLASGFKAQLKQAFDNLMAVLLASGKHPQDIVKLTIFLDSMDDFPQVNDMMANYLDKPYPARSVIQATYLPKGALVEIEAIAG